MGPGQGPFDESLLTNDLHPKIGPFGVVHLRPFGSDLGNFLMGRRVSEI